MARFVENQPLGVSHDHLYKRRELAARLLLFALGSLSILSLLLYFLGTISLQAGTVCLLSAELAGLLALLIRARRDNAEWFHKLLFSGLWAGGLATLAYDIVRIPVAHAGIPVFKAISYFGTVLVGVESPTPLSEILGWGYHLTNGISFGLMYAALVRKPRVYSAVIWGLALEAVMLLTPYAEVFGYRRDAKFLAITIGAHVVYGLVLYLALRLWAGIGSFRLTPFQITTGSLCVPLGILLIAADFHTRYAGALPPSPPPYIGPHLYTTWDVPEPDRVVAMWVTRRFVESRARFYFIKPFDPIRYGQAFDLPEAQIRRHGMRSATQFILDEQGLNADPKLSALARMTYLTEVTPWMLATDPEAGRLTQIVRDAAEKECGQTLNVNCAERLFETLNQIYQGE
jgi:hypothetical protein